MVTWGFPLEKTLQEDVPEDSTKFLQPLGLRTAGARGQGLMRLDVSWEDGAFSNMGYDGVCSNLPQRIQERFQIISFSCFGRCDFQCFGFSIFLRGLLELVYSQYSGDGSKMRFVQQKHHWLVFWNIFIFPYIGNNNPN